MSDGHGESRGAVVAALLANLGIALAKLAAAIVTGSSSMLAEAVHSFADCGNQGLLLVGGWRSTRRPDEQHPFGFGRERYFYAFVVAVVLFSLGSLFALYEGVEKVRHPHELDHPPVAIGVLAVAIVLESLSFRTAFRAADPVRRRTSLSWVGFIRRAKAPELPVVLLEDSAALLGLLFAMAGVLLSMATGSTVWDGVGTLAIGVLLGLVATVLAVETKSLLIGESATPEVRRAIGAAVAGSPEVRRVIHLRTLHLGPEELLVAAKIELVPGLDLPAVGAAIDAVEARLRAAEPTARWVYLEPDLYRDPARPLPGGPAAREAPG